MAAYDKLPRSVRDALKYAYGNYAAFPIERRWQQGRYGNDVRDVVRSIKRSDERRKARDRKALLKFLARNRPGKLRAVGKAVGFGRGA
jgi:hypothetical protein